MILDALRIALLFAAVPAGMAAAHDGVDHGSATPATAVWGDEPLAIPDLPVTAADGTIGGLRSLLPESAPVILSFTYTGCESLCDITNAVLLAVDEDLPSAGPRLEGARVVTLTIDPVTDTPERLDAARRDLGSSDRWLWLTGGTRGTRPILDLLRFPPGAVEDHDPVFLVGRVCAGRFTRVIGLPDPEDLLAIARGLPECGA